jgi:retron-type reverse transcriptase
MSLETPDKIRSLQRKLYHKAKTEPEFRFYLLYDKICREDILHHAYDLAHQNAGAPGVDGVTFEDIEKQGVEGWIAGLREDLVSKTYRPDPVRRVTIPKPGGGERPLGIPTIRDRVAQAAAKIVLEPIFEAGFEDSAHGYRPRRSAVDAVKETHRLLCHGYTDVVDADLSKYFDTIPHSDLLKSVARRVVDRHVLWLIELWLKAPVEQRDGDGKRRMSGGKSNKRGTPQGGVLSPLLANIYMNRFLKHWRLTGCAEAFRARIVNYADDFVISRRMRSIRPAQPRSRARGSGVDAGRDDEARADAQRGENLGEGRSRGELRFPRLHPGTEMVSQDRRSVLGSRSLEEERTTDQDEGRRLAVAGRERRMAESGEKTQPPARRLVGLFLPWVGRRGLSSRQPTRRRPGTQLPAQTTQNARTGHTTLLREPSVRGARRAAPSTRA